MMTMTTVTKNANSWRDWGHSDCDCRFCKGCVFSLCCLAAFELLLRRAGYCVVIRLIGRFIWLPAFFRWLRKKKGKHSPAEGSGWGVYKRWMGNCCLTSLPLLLSLPLSPSMCLSRVEDEIFRQQKTRLEQPSVLIWQKTPRGLSGCCS